MGQIRLIGGWSGPVMLVGAVVLVDGAAACYVSMELLCWWMELLCSCGIVLLLGWSPLMLFDELLCWWMEMLS